jgi:hypothetical protein
MSWKLDPEILRAESPLGHLKTQAIIEIPVKVDAYWTSDPIPLQLLLLTDPVILTAAEIVDVQIRSHTCPPSAPKIRSASDHIDLILVDPIVTLL